MPKIPKGLRRKFDTVSSKRYKLACTPIEDSDPTEYLRNRIIVLDVRSMGNQGYNVYSDGRLWVWSESTMGALGVA